MNAETAAPYSADGAPLAVHVPKQRKQRPHFNCAECRRLKLRCDRTVPCQNCVKRACREICPNGTRDGPRSVKRQRVGESNVAPTPRLSTGSLVNATDPPTIDPLDIADRSTALPRPGLNRASSSSNTLSQTQTYPQDKATETWMSRVTAPSSSTMGPPSVPPAQHAQEATVSSPTTQSHGTLVMSHTGSSKYLGPSAASEWLKDAEVLEASETPMISRAASPALPQPGPLPSHSTFPFSTQPSRSAPSLSRLLSSLPELEEAEALIDSYHRYFGWSYDIATRGTIQKIMEGAYNSTSRDDLLSAGIDAQQIALLFIVLAMGAMHSLELPPDDTAAVDYLTCSEDCLVRGRFMSNHTMAGVQTLIVMAHYHLETDRGRNGDSAWTLWGLAMRAIQAMGLHRDGERWNLPAEVVEDRRRLFWESHSAEIFQANCFSRPYTIPAEFVDTKLPAEKASEINGHYHTLKFQLSKIAKDVLHAALAVDTPPYGTIAALYERLHLFERSVPFQLRCRTALLSLPSLYSEAGMAEAESPEINRRDLRRTFERFSLSMMISETVVNLHRPYFLRALIECPSDPLRTDFGQAYLSVVERSNVIIQVVCELYAIHPSVTARHWWCWYHAFNSAVCLGTLVLMSPGNELVPIALGAMDQVIAIYTDNVNSRAAPRLVQNLRWLLSLRQRAAARVEQLAQLPQGAEGQPPDSDAETDAGLLGWRTRFIERAGRGRQKAVSISIASPLTPSLSSTGDLEGVIRSTIQEHISASRTQADSRTSPSGPGVSTDQLLHQFWDPKMLAQDAAANQSSSLSWWDVLSQPPGFLP